LDDRRVVNCLCDSRTQHEINGLGVKLYSFIHMPQHDPYPTQKYLWLSIFYTLCETNTKLANLELKDLTLLIKEIILLLTYIILYQT
jgi:hypothetical protein